MLQRVQTLFLLGVVILMLFFSFSEIWYKSTINPTVSAEIKHKEEVTMKFTGYTLTKSGLEPYSETFPTYLTLGITIIIILDSLSTIFLYKNRKIQLLMGNFINLLLAGLIIILIYNIQQAEALLGGEPEKTIYYIPFYFPIISIFLIFFANRYIRKDEKLVQSMDRIRD